MAHMALMTALTPATTRRLWAARPVGPVVAQEPWGRLEQVADGVWALISTPLQDRTTLCNGGIVAGADGVVLIESFASVEGAAWMSEQARELTGRWPTHAVVTHYHGDHSGGITGLGGDGSSPALHLSAATRDLLAEGDAGRDGGAPSDRVRALADAELLAVDAPTTVDLGGRRVRVVPRSGHTASDVTIELDEPSVVFCGDLVWNEMFPNYMDAVPTALSRSVRGLRRDAPTTYVPGHGPLADAQALDRFLAVIDAVEGAARRAFDAGVPAAEAAEAFELPASVGEWFLFNPAYFERALSAWEQELSGAG
jgi:glyoxylase-like metal-dependent hydrolase (beta-lactamase superfamily II)